MRGRFITLEGIDGAGKTTHLEWIVDFLRGRGISVTSTREPGGTPLGERVRDLVLHSSAELNAETETLLMFAARREHIDKVIEPALASGTWVVCDRFTDATFAYQAAGSGVSWSKVEQLERWVQDGMAPDATILLDVSPEVGLARAGRGKHPDRFESERLDFYERVRQAYLERARAAPHRVFVLDAVLPLANIHEELKKIVLTLCS